MTTHELNGFRKILATTQTQLGTVCRTRETLTIETSPDELDRIQNASTRDCVISDLERNRMRLHEVGSALERIDNGTFGVCVSCGVEINPKRLAAVPWASSCILCQEGLDLGREMQSEMDQPLRMAA